MTATHVRWARKVNSRWLVHEGLSEATAAYLDHLAMCDPARLTRACRIAYDLVHESNDKEDADPTDPKPVFYGGLFSVATRSEAEKYLSGHLYTRLLHPSFSEAEVVVLTATTRLHEATLLRIHALRRRIIDELATNPCREGRGVRVKQS